jgi:peptidoglycan/LPS O-acetylase OafA/YrhL
MSQWIAAVLGLVAAGLLGRLAVEWQRYARGEHIITRKQLGLRAASGLVVVALLALVVVGVSLEFTRAQSAALYWSACLVLAAAAIMLAMADLWQVRKTARARRAEIYRRISAYIRQVGERRRADRTADE